MGLDKTVRKWTTGANSSSILRKEFLKIMTAINDDLMSPIEVVEPIGMSSGPSFFEYTMPFIEGETGFTTDKFNLVADAIKSSIKHRCRERVSGFKLACRRELDVIYSLDSKLCAKYDQKFSQMIDASSDIYPSGFCHGDMGLANIIIDGNSVKCIGLTHSFIQTPLFDVATYCLSLKSSVVKEEHIKLRDELLSFFDKYLVNIVLLQKIRMLSWLPHIKINAYAEEVRSMIDD